MIHPLLKVLVTRPEWLVEHAQAYAELAAEQAGAVSSAWTRQALLLVLGLVLLTLGLGLTGVAVMLWAVVGELPPPRLTLLWVTPAMPLALGLVCVLSGLQQRPAPAFEGLKRQWQADLDLLHEPTAP